MTIAFDLKMAHEGPTIYTKTVVLKSFCYIPPFQDFPLLKNHSSFPLLKNNTSMTKVKNFFVIIQICDPNSSYPRKFKNQHSILNLSQIPQFLFIIFHLYIYQWRAVTFETSHTIDMPNPSHEIGYIQNQFLS